MRMKTLAILLGLTSSALTTGAAVARVRASDASALATDRILSPAIQTFDVSSPAFGSGGAIPDQFTAFGKNVSPPIVWDGAPPSTQAYVVIMEDPDDHGATPTLHWLAYNIPATAKGLPKDVRNRGEPKAPAGIMQGVNSKGGIGYVGPHPAAGDPPHHYHIEVFALDRPLKIKPKASLDQVIAAMNERVLGEGELTGAYAAPDPAAK